MISALGGSIGFSAFTVVSGGSGGALGGVFFSGISMSGLSMGWDAGHFDWLFSVSFRSYLALITLVNSRVHHTVHQWEPVLFSKHLLGLGFS